MRQRPAIRHLGRLLGQCSPLWDVADAIRCEPSSVTTIKSIGSQLLECLIDGCSFCDRGIDCEALINSPVLDACLTAGTFA